MFKWIRRALKGAPVLAALVVSTGVVYEQWSRAGVARDFPPVGQLIEHDGRLSHLHCTGDGSPTVVLEAGLDIDGSQTWASIQPEIAAETRVCSYDRAGILWSEPRDEPRDANRIAAELHSLLDAASEPPPYVMVGHSLGGLLVRVYSERFPGEVAGFVFVDASHPEQFDRYPTEVLELLAAQPEPPSLLLTRVLAATGVLRLRSPPTREDAAGAFLWRSVAYGFYGERRARDAISEQAAETGTLGDRPLVVLSSGVAPRMPGVTDEVLEELYETWLVLQAELATLSTNSDHRTIEGATHYIHRDAPDTVIAAVREVVDAVRRGTSVQREAGS